MDNLIENILEYLKEANEKHWSTHTIKYDLKKMIDTYVDSEIEHEKTCWMDLARI